MNIETLSDLFAVEMHRAYSMETQLAEELETLERDAAVDALDDLQSQTAETRETLKELFAHHRDQTRTQIERLEDALEALGRPGESRSTPALDGLLAEKELFNNVVLSDDLRPLYYLGVARQIEHLEITTYERLLRFASHLNVPDEVRDALERNLEEERAMLETFEDVSDDEAVTTLLEEEAAVGQA